MMEKLASAHSVQRMSQAFGVSRSGYYKHLSQGINSKRSIENISLSSEIMKVWVLGRRVYGSPRITEAIRKKGHKVNKKRIVRLMKCNHIQAIRKKKYQVTTDSQHNKPVAANLLMQNFKVDELNKVWLSDITYIWTREGFLYLAVIMDLCSRMPVGYSMQADMRTSLIMTAFDRAIAKSDLTPISRQ